MKYFIVIIFVFLISSCALFRKTTDNQLVNIDSVVLIKPDYETLSYKFLLKYISSDQSINMFGNFINYKDSLLFFDISPGFGIKFAEVFISPDTTIVYLPLQKQAFVGGSDLLLNKYNIALNFYSLQAIFNANLFTYPYFIHLDEYTVTSDTSFFVSNKILNKRNNSITDIFHSFRFNKNNNISNVTISDYVLNKQLLINYFDYNIIDSVYTFPNKAYIQLIDVDTSAFDLKFKNIKYNNNLNFDFSLQSNVQIINL